MPARKEELDIMELFEPSGPVEHEPTSRPHGQAATALFDVEDEAEEAPAGLGVRILRPQGACRIRMSHVLSAVVQ